MCNTKTMEVIHLINVVNTPALFPTLTFVIVKTNQDG